MYALTVSYKSSCSAGLTPDEVYQVIDSYINLEDNSIGQLVSDGIVVECTEPVSGHFKFVDDICVTFVHGRWASIHEAIVNELQSMSDALDQEYSDHLYEMAVNLIKTAIVNSDIAQSEVGLPSCHPGLWELVETRSFTIKELDAIAKSNGWNS